MNFQRRRPNPNEDLNIDSRVELNKLVTNIQWNGARALVSCSDGSQYSAEYVIFTASLGVLKARHHSLFTPALPARKITAIQNIAFGSLEKFFLEFDVPFWPSTADWAKYSILWSEADIALVRGTAREW